MTTSTTGRPWGVLDDEITVDYADSTRLTSDMMLDFFPGEVANIHIELMRLRSQAYSSLYGYAGTAINPYSYISLFDFDLSHRLSKEHLDKIREFHQGLVTLENELPSSLKLVRGWNGSIMNLNRVNAHLYLIYHQVSVPRRKAKGILMSHVSLTVDPCSSPTSPRQHLQRLVRLAD